MLYNNAGTGGKSVRLAATKEQDILSSFKLNACAHVLMTQVFKKIYICFKHLLFSTISVHKVVSATPEGSRRCESQRTGRPPTLGGDQHQLDSRIHGAEQRRRFVRLSHVEGNNLNFKNAIKL